VHAGEIGRAVQADDRLAGARGPANACGAVEGAAHQGGLLGVQKGHPVFDGGGQLCLGERLAHLVFGQQGAVVEQGVGQLVENGLGQHERDLLLLRADVGGKVRHGDGEHSLDLAGAQPVAARPQMLVDVVGPDDLDRPDLAEAPLATVHGQGDANLTWSQPELGEGGLGSIGDIGQAHDIVGHVCLPEKQVAACDREVVPVLGVDDPQPRRPDHHEVELRVLRAGPVPIGEQMVAMGGQGREARGEPTLGDRRGGEAASFIGGALGLELVGERDCGESLRLLRSGCSGRHVYPLWVHPRRIAAGWGSAPKGAPGRERQAFVRSSPSMSLRGGKMIDTGGLAPRKPEEMPVSNEVQLISDGDGLAVIGDPHDVEQFLVAEGLTSRDLGLPRLSTILHAGTIAADTASAIAANSGRWVEISEKSMRLINENHLMPGSSGGLSRGIVQADGGKIQHIVEFAQGPGAWLANPAVLAGAAGIMAQLALKQSMDEISDYLATIDEKVDDVLRAQKDAVLADMIGVGFVIDDAMTVRDQVGRVSDVTWSKVQGTAATIATTQAYALRQLDALAEKLESKSNMDDLAKASKGARESVQGWLAVLARCFQLHDALAVLELDRILDAEPSELDKHRVGLKEAQQNRLDLITRNTGRLLSRIDHAAAKANERVLLHPIDSRAVVESSNHVAAGIHHFQTRLGIEGDRKSIAAKKWTTAAGETKDQLVEAGSDGIDAVGRLGGRALGGARSVADKIAIRVAEQALRRRDDGEGPDDAVR
jgi:hypothetical protein